MLLLCKKFMSDPGPFRVICMLSANACAAFRAGFIQPSGNAERRVISEALRKNIMSKAPTCRKQGSVSAEAETYLLGWAQGTWPRIPRPLRYNFLELRTFDIPGVAAVHAAWTAPPRFRVYTILRSDDDSGDSGDDDNPLEPIVGP